MRTDIVVIGGGAVGAAVAYFVKLLDPSTQISVVERDPTYSLASTLRGSGGVRRLFSLPENIELSKFSIAFFDTFAETMAVDGVKADIGLQKHGYLFIVPPSARDGLKRNFDIQQRLGCNVLWLEPDELKQMLPSMNVSDLGAAVYSPDDGWLVNRGVLMGFRNKATSMGVEFLADEVVGLVRKGKSVTTAKLTSGQLLEASHFVNAAGAWAKDICALLDIHVPIEPLRRFEHYFESQDPIEPLPYIKDTKALAFRPEGNGYSGGVPTLAEPRGYNFEVDDTYFERVVWPALAHRFPQFEKAICKGTRSGLYDQNDFDGNVIIGPGADGLGNFHMLAGFSGHGLMHAPGCGRAMAELLLKGRYETIDLTRFGWQRLLDGTPIREEGII
jgi:FAD-dependent oxidoreductase domain-containing protein 1